jgi:hypothetical protein
MKGFTEGYKLGAKVRVKSNFKELFLAKKEQSLLNPRGSKGFVLFF